MRVVQLVTQERGGPVDHAVDVACELAARGHESHLIGPVAAAAPRLARAGVTWHADSMTGKTDLAGALRLARRIATLRVDILHCQDRRAGLVGRTVATARRRGAVVYTLHGVADGLSDLVAGNARAAPRRHRDRLYYLTAERRLAQLAGSRVIVPSEAVARFATVHIGLPPDRVDVVANGVDPHRFSPAAPDRAAPDPVAPPTVLWLGVLAPVKQVDVLLRAVAQVPGLALRLVGDGPERDALERLATSLGMADRVTFAGAVADPAPAFAGATLFVLASAAENCPLALLQAMAAGLPVVATRVGGIPEVVRDGIDGVLVPPGDVSALARQLRSLLADPSYLNLLGKQARERILARYTIGHCVDGLLESYRRALEPACGS